MAAGRPSSVGGGICGASGGAAARNSPVDQYNRYHSGASRRMLLRNRRMLFEMKDYVVDASVAVQWLVDEENSTQALQLLYGEVRLIAPDLIFAEVANALWKMQRRREIEIEQMEKAINTLRFSPMLSPASMQELSTSAIRIAAEIDHAVYDCYYLALAVRSNCEVVTADKRFLNKVRSRAEFSGCIFHVSEVASELGHDPDAENVVHEPLPLRPSVYDITRRLPVPGSRHVREDCLQRTDPPQIRA